MVLDKYELLTDKIYHTIIDIYLKHNDFDWYIKADDDTFLFMDNLRDFLKDKDPSNPVTYGYDFGVHVTNGYHSGGINRHN